MDTRTKLITHPHPSVRVCAMRALEGRGADDPAVAELAARIPQVPPVSDILAAQYPAGSWMQPTLCVGAHLGVSPRYRATVWQVLFLAQLGVGPDPAVIRAVDVLRRDNLDEEGAFHLRRGNRGQSLALTGALLWATARLSVTGLADWANTWRWVDAQMAGQGVSATDVLWTMRAAASWGRECQTDAGAVWRGAVPLDPAQMVLVHPVTLEPDHLTMMVACVEVGQAERIPPDALRWLRARQLSSGDWPVDRVPGRLWWSPSAVGQPNPWVTIRALQVLEHVKPGVPSQTAGQH